MLCSSLVVSGSWGTVESIHHSSAMFGSWGSHDRWLLHHILHSGSLVLPKAGLDLEEVGEEGRSGREMRDKNEWGRERERRLWKNER